MDNTTVEWGYAYNAGDSGGTMATSNRFDGMNTSGINFANYDSFVHNHSQVVQHLEQSEMEELNSLPSRQDVKFLAGKDGVQGHIYNEVTGTWHDYDQNSKTQEDWYVEHGFLWDKETNSWYR